MTLTSSCLQPCNGSARMPLKGRIDETEEEINLSDRSIESFNKINYIFNFSNIKVLTLSHNKIKSIPYEIDKLYNLERLNLFNNYIPDLPNSICNLSKLRLLNVGMNNIHSLPQGMSRLTMLEVLDLTYNFLDENSFPVDFFTLENLKALYLSDNELEIVPTDIRSLKSLQIITLRDNNLISLPGEIGMLSRLRELLIQNNRLKMLAPELCNFDISSQRSTIRMEGNPLDPELADQLKLGVSHVLDFIRSDYYRARYVRHMMEMATITPPPKNEERKNRKLLRLKGK
ncbi:hypothetical protein RDWZM_003389 [Blomia tropicalis]|uniref:Disease resistance R13L4/SHOC-2-like LRR domain-containing protein n=1 Tax=Blomia tropicalis TaxID=40697 RepID=A0A9Q0RSH3_BLOTA|nr:Ras suppressor protein 1 [Blomia tropicalis]KAJ6224844.1 hypothetical protein RDWZM_003389 [Blomia tropicalis]